MPIISGFPAGGNAKFPEGGKTDQVLVKTEEGEAWGNVKTVAEKATQKPISFQVTGLEGEEFTIEFTEDGEGGSGGVESFNGRSGAVVPQTGDYTAEMVGADTSGSAAQALADAKQYTDDEIKKIPTPDVSAQIQAHNIAGDTHNDIRTLVNDHIANKSNPHGVTAAQIGAAAATHQHAATDITSGTFAAARIPNLAASKINSGTFSVARGGTGLSSLTSGSFLRGNGTGAVSLTTLAQLKSELGIGGGKTATKYTESVSNIIPVKDSQTLCSFSSSSLSGQTWEIVLAVKANKITDWDYLYNGEILIGYESGRRYGTNVSIGLDSNATSVSRNLYFVFGYISLSDIDDSFSSGIAGISYCYGDTNGAIISFGGSPNTTSYCKFDVVADQYKDRYNLSKGAKISYLFDWSTNASNSNPFTITRIALTSYRYV